MKVKHVLMIAAVLLAMLAVPVSAEDTTTVTYTPQGGYELVIPEGMTVGTAGDIGISGLLNDYSQVTLSVDSENDWNLALSSGKDKLAYALTWTEDNEEKSISADGNLMTVKADEIAESDEQEIVISATATLNDGVKAKYQGEHTDILTFTATETVFTPVSDATELSNAISEGKNVILTNDIEVSNLPITIAIGNSITLDLNGYKLSGNSNSATSSALIHNKGDLTITGSGTITTEPLNPDKGDTPWYASNTITNGGTLLITDGVVVENTASSDAYATYPVDNNGGKFILDGGTLKDAGTALRVVSFGNKPEFIMNSGLIEGSRAVWIHLPSYDSNSAPEITVTINGGTLKSTNSPSSSNNNVMNTYSYGQSYANTKITINGGNFVGGTVSIGGYGATWSGARDVPEYQITGGTFDYNVLVWNADGTTTEVPFS